MCAGTAVALGLGGVAALAAFAVGMAFMRPATVRAAALQQEMATAKTPQERDQRTAEIQALRARAAGAGRVVGLLLLLSAAAMAVARFV